LTTDQHYDPLRGAFGNLEPLMVCGRILVLGSVGYLVWRVVI
jgi:hypothetical protein